VFFLKIGFRSSEKRIKGRSGCILRHLLAYFCVRVCKPLKTRRRLVDSQVRFKTEDICFVFRNAKVLT